MSIEDDTSDEEKAFLPFEEKPPAPNAPPRVSQRFLLCAGINTFATAGIVFVNKRLFENKQFRHEQVTFAAFHFGITALLLYTLSRPAINVFQAKQAPLLKILPLASAMILNVVLPNASLAYSSIQFYQIVRVLMTPCVALLNYMISRSTIPLQAAMALVPICIGVGVVSYYDAMPVEGAESKGTTPLGVLFAFAGVIASSIYTVWIARYHKVLEMTSMQLLLNQAPVSVLIMLYIIPFSDDITIWQDTPLPSWLLIGLSGVFACMINLSQFFIINEAGPVSSTVVGHLKTCCIVALGWMYSGKALTDGSLIGIVLAIGGIISYSAVMHKQTRA